MTQDWREQTNRRPMICTYAACVEMADNAQWKNIPSGDKGGTYEHYTVVAHRVIPPEELKCIGIYGKDWVDDFVRKNTRDQLLDTVVRPCAIDFDALALLVSVHINCAVNVSEEMPPLDIKILASVVDILLVFFRQTQPPVYKSNAVPQAFCSK